VLNGCAGNLAGSDIAKIADRLDPAIKVIVSAHTHAEYRCTYTSNGVTRLITSASSFGRVLSDITLTIDNKNDKLVSASANNILIRNATNVPGSGRACPIVARRPGGAGGCQSVRHSRRRRSRTASSATSRAT
jgi:5'-nucleotidase